ncbi:hypothetical protein [Liquorilactobacillus oeni]|uniref:hypothetical protein n=1 Tax=Liquorilactobacillus oeni TaxID=303241 RepID=UPI00070FFD7D|nr:hypothetical protein [Liquorilactobacillus oeni]
MSKSFKIKGKDYDISIKYIDDIELEINFLGYLITILKKKTAISFTTCPYNDNKKNIEKVRALQLFNTNDPRNSVCSYETATVEKGAATDDGYPQYTLKSNSGILKKFPKILTYYKLWP